LQQHENVRANTLGFGPWILDAVVPGEAYLYVPNPNFWLGPDHVPKLDSIEMRIIAAPTVPLSAQAGDFDVIITFPQSMVDAFPNPPNYTYIGVVGAGSVFFTGFQLGYWDAENLVNVTDPDAKMACLSLRRAMSLAIPWVEIGNHLFSGLVVPAPSNLAYRHVAYMNPHVNHAGYDPDLANFLLDEAGYTQRCPAGFRMTPAGEELIIYYLRAQPTTVAAETNAWMQIQSFHDIGLNVQLYEDRFHESARVSEYNNMHGIRPFDIFDFGWSFGANPTQQATFGPNAISNRPRSTSAEMDAAIATIQGDPRMWDPEFSLQAHWDWQQAFYDYLPAFPTNLAVSIHAVNNRVWGYSTDTRIDPRLPGNWQWHLVRVTAEERYAQ
jgi:peptide/nickel transport system substrate-binding protein